MRANARLQKLERVRGTDDLRLLPDDVLESRIARCCERLGIPAPLSPMIGPDFKSLLRDARSWAMGA